MLSMSHEVLISCIDECTEDDDDDDEESNFIQEVDCILTESSQPVHPRNNLMIKQRALLSPKFASRDSGTRHHQSSEQLEFLSPTQSDEVIEESDTFSCCNADN